MRKILGLTLVLLILAACGIDNTMYNAQQYFKTAQGRALNANGRPTPQAVDEYTKTIKKCGVILSGNKKSRRADDALYLMARALYYKGNSAFQAKDAFQSLIQGYPNSKYVPEANIYMARVLREINQVKESEALLERFVRDPKYLKYHPRALLVLADFEIKDKDYHRAQFWLERIIKDYRKTKEFREAFFLFGKNYYMQKDYARSLEQFEKFQKTRGIDKEMKLEGQYYIALNQYELGQYDLALRNARNLIRNEIRPNNLGLARVLYARVLLAQGKNEDGLKELGEVTKAYPRTEQAAAAYYFWGRHLYYHDGNIDGATPHLNKVRTEYSNSPYAAEGQKFATALSQIKPPANLNSRQNLQAYLDYQYLKAEYYISPLALPDSALATYQAVIDEYHTLKAECDSLNARISTIFSRVDSLNALPELVSPDSTAVPIEDSIAISPIEGQPDSLNALPELISPDSTAVPIEDSIAISPIEEQPDSLNTELFPDITEAVDSLSVVDTTIAEPDSNATPPSQIARTPSQLREEALLEIDELQTRVDALNDIISRFEREILPFCHFSRYGIYRNMPGREETANEVLTLMQRDFSRNMYTRAAIAVSSGTTPRLVDPDLEAAEEAFDAALGHYPEHPDSLVSEMLDFRESRYPELQLRANYRLGWYYSFEAPDTTLAKDYLQSVLDQTDSGDYGVVVRRFYDGAKYLLRDSGLVDTLNVADSLAMPDSIFSDSLQTSISIPDSLAPALPDSLGISPADSLGFIPPPLADSLFVLPDSLQNAMSDSLQVLPDQTDQPLEETEDEHEDPAPTPPPDIISPEKNEEADPE